MIYSLKINSPEGKGYGKYFQQVLYGFYESGYLEARIDSISKDSLHVVGWFYAGPIYKWAQLSPGNLSPDEVADLGFKESKFINTLVSPSKVKSVLEKTVCHFENNGYPFVAVSIDSIRIQQGMVFGALSVEKNKRIVIDSLVVLGNATISTKFLRRYLQIQPGQLYNESSIASTGAKLKELPFLKEQKPLRVLFAEKETKLILELERRKSNQFDGIIGFLPDPISGKLLFTGNLSLKLQNSFFGQGEVFAVDWHSLKAQSQDLTIASGLPFLAGSSWGIEDAFNFFKQDTTYTTLKNQLDISYMLTPGNFVKLLYHFKGTNLISTSGLGALSVLPNVIDMKAGFYGLGIKMEHLDYKFNPRKGYSFQVNASVGTKSIVKNSNINSTLYDGIELHSVEYTGDMQLSIYTPVKGRSTFKWNLQSAFLNGQQLFQNELFRLGGLNSLRGFDELSIYASSYVIATLEYRFILETNSYLHLFFNQAFYENNSINKYVTDVPWGVGTGISFGTKAGIFSIDYALGSQFGAMLDPRIGKVHFGIVNYFN